jgi:RNA polymerase sigma-70 factor (ECF subfamily)
VVEQDGWVARLRATGPEREAAIADLRKILVRGLSHSLAQRGGGDAFAEDVAQEAVMKVLHSLDSFEGRSRFTTWAMTIATRIGISELRRRHFQDVSLDQASGSDSLQIDLAVDRAPTPETQAERESVLRNLRRLINEQLTDRQRMVMQALLNGMPVEEIARRTGSNRNAVYKLVFDARKKLRAGLEEAGVQSDDIRSLFA